MAGLHSGPYRGHRHRNRPSPTGDKAQRARPSYDALRGVLNESLQVANREVVDKDSPGSFALSYLQDQIGSKFDPGDKASASLRRAEAIRRFWLAETMCKETNDRLARGNTPGNLVAVIRRAKEIIRDVLGPLRDRDDVYLPVVLNRIAEGFGHGPGATTRVPRRQGNPCFKFSGIPEVTASCAIWGDAAIRSIPRWTESITDAQVGPERLLWNLAVGNRVITVPKNSQTERCISIEPDLNIYVQKGFGAYIRERLLRIGIDLSDQTRNQRLARIGAFVGSLATVDLSMASDTVSDGVVRLLLPRDWYETLEEVRSRCGVLPSDFWSNKPEWASRLTGSSLLYQKFSSMGNGFTFELETLIFWSLAQACAEEHLGVDTHRVSCYGDDIICPVESVGLLFDALSYLGFKPNGSKTFSDGPFRESCGKHYFREHDVSPFYVRRPLLSLRETLLFANNLRRWLWRVEALLPNLALRALERAYERIRDSLPEVWRKPRIPDGFGDGALIGYFDECTPDADPDGTEAWRVQVLSDVPRLLDDNLPFGAFIVSLRRLESHDSNRVFFPDEVIGVTPMIGVKTRKLNLLVPWRVTWP